MNADELRSLQAPIKERYKNDPKAALITLRAQGRIAEGVACRVDTGKVLVEAGLHPATGGSGLQACSGDMTALQVSRKDAKVTAEGDLDFRGTLGVSKDAPVGFREIRLKFELRSDAPEAQLKKLLELTERYCVVMQTLRNATRVEVS